MSIHHSHLGNESEKIRENKNTASATVTKLFFFSDELTLWTLFFFGAFGGKGLIPADSIASAQMSLGGVADPWYAVTNDMATLFSLLIMQEKNPKSIFLRTRQFVPVRQIDISMNNETLGYF